MIIRTVGSESRRLLLLVGRRCPVPLYFDAGRDEMAVLKRDVWRLHDALMVQLHV